MSVPAPTWAAFCPRTGCPCQDPERVGPGDPAVLGVVASLALVAHRLANPIEEDTEAAMYGLTNEQMQDPETRERAYAIPQVSRVGWYRWNPCSRRSCEDGGGHTGHLAEVDGPGPGNWVGVRFQDPWFA